jgi:branched-chain amino acid transport system permease protein
LATLLDTLVYGTVQSVALILMAFGFSLVYGVSRLPNFAHGAVYVLTGFVAWALVHRAGLPYLAAIPLALAGSALVGVAIYQLVLRRIRGMEISEVIATYAIGLAILEGLRWAGFRGSMYSLPAFSNGVAFIFDVPVDHQRIAVVVLGLAMIAALRLFTRHTRIGLALRGIAQDERAAMMLGIDSDMTATVAVALGSALAGLGAVILLPLGSVVVEEGYKVLIYAIAVCVVGGLGSWAGTVVASFVLGFSQYLTVAYGKPHYQMVVMLVAIIVTLILRPSGLFGQQKQLEERV